MAQWGTTDDAANSVLWGVSQFSKTANTYNQANLFSNTTVSGFVTGQTTGQFALDATEIALGQSNCSVVAIQVTSSGSGYFVNAVATIGGNATGNAQSNATGGVTVNVTLPGNTYSTPPTVTIAAPAAQTFSSNTAVGTYFNANSAVTDAADTIAITTANTTFPVGEAVRYYTTAGNTVISGLANGTQYFIATSNSTVLTLAATSGGANINITKGLTEGGHVLTRDGFIAITTNKYQNGDITTYTAPTGNTVPGGLTNATSYFVVSANSSGLKLSATYNGSNIAVVPGVSETGHNFVGQTATASAVLSGVAKGQCHTGWVLRTVGTGGRAGRVQYETLVAMGGGISDDSEDTILKDV